MASHLPQVKITNIIAKSCIIPPFSLSSLAAETPLANTFPGSFFKFESPAGKDNRKTKFSVFLSGAIISRASSSVLALESAFLWLREFLGTYNLKLIDRHEILNVVAVSHLTPPLKLIELASHLLHCSYDSTPLEADNSHEYLVDAVTFYFNPGAKPRRTALIFPTGNVTLTGFRSVSDMESHALKLASVLSEIRREHPEVLR